jgi:hypothetical protein
MIKIIELRIGSWVNYKDKIDTPDFKPIQIDVSDLILLQRGVKETTYEGIEINDHTLHNCDFGYKRQTNVDGLIEYSFLRSINMSKSYDILLTVINGEYRIYKEMKVVGVRRLKYIHQLQSWFFFNTGIELQYVW